MNSCCRWAVICVAMALTAGLGSSALAMNRLAIDGLHGEPRIQDWNGVIRLDSLYPDMHFTCLDAAHIPVHEVLAAGTTNGTNGDTLSVDVPAGAHALYVIMVGPLVQYALYWSQYPFITLRRDDQTVASSGYGVAHLDSPQAGVVG